MLGSTKPTVVPWYNFNFHPWARSPEMPGWVLRMLCKDDGDVRSKGETPPPSRPGGGESDRDIRGLAASWRSVLWTEKGESLRGNPITSHLQLPRAAIPGDSAQRGREPTPYGSWLDISATWTLQGWLSGPQAGDRLQVKSHSSSDQGHLCLRGLTADSHN